MKKGNYLIVRVVSLFSFSSSSITNETNGKGYGGIT
mgnify:CR=1 FL=1